MPQEPETPDQSPDRPWISACDTKSPPPSLLSQPGVDAVAHFDLVIIGAGPAALAVVSRILEARPAALYTEDEHRHLHFTHRQRPLALIPSKVAKNHTYTQSTLAARHAEAQRDQPKKKRGKGLWNVATPKAGGVCPCDGRIKILVIDRLGEGFLGLWRRNFRALGISHLRSPMFFHPDASDFDALIAYANQHGQAGEGTPDQVIDLIEQRISAGKCAASTRGRRARRRSKAKRPSSPIDPEQTSAQKGSGSDLHAASLPDLIEILGVVGKEKSKHKRKQQQLQPREHHSNATAATSTKVHVNERDRRDYFTPSSSLFDAFTRELEHKYRVQSCDDRCSSTWPKVSEFFEGDVDSNSSEGSGSASSDESAGLQDSPVTTLKGRVKDLAWLDGAKRTVQDDFGNHHPGFLLELDDGTDAKLGDNNSVAISAKAVVNAVGFGGVPMIPPYLSSCPSQAASAPPACGPGWMHSGCLAAQPFPAPSPLPSNAHRRERKMVVVGGGLTSAQIVVRALEEGYDKVTLLTRGHLKSKPFDVDLGWVGRYSNYLKMQFWQNEDVQERLTTLRAARNGGSVTPTYAKVLARLEALGKVEIRTHTTISSAAYVSTTVLDRPALVPSGDDEPAHGSATSAEEESDANSPHQDDLFSAQDDVDKQWSLHLRSSLDGGKDESVRADYLVVATGAKIDFGGLPFMQTVQKTHPVRLVGGFPVLTADLEYRRDVPLFVTGAYAGLQIGPAAGNLGGMRDSADRIANRLLELLSLPEAVVPKVQRDIQAGVAEQDEVKEEKRTSPGPVAKVRNEPARAEKATPFTHFNFDLLSIEA